MSLKIEGLFLKGQNFSTQPVEKLLFDLEGIVGAKKYRGHTRTVVNGRERYYFDQKGPETGIVNGEEVFNWRQVSALEVNEVDMTRRAMKALPLTVSNEEMAMMMGANVLFSQVDEVEQELQFSATPAGRLLKFPSGAILYVFAENTPCEGPGQEIHRRYPTVKENAFQRASYIRRGILAIVFRGGLANVGDIVETSKIKNT